MLLREQYSIFFDEIGYLTRTGVLRVERVLATFGASIRLGWALWEPAVNRLREEWLDPTMFGNFEYLHNQGLEFDRKSGGTGASPTKQELRHFVETQQQLEIELHLAMFEKEPGRAGT
jgi:hypothetical protein